MNFLAKGLGFLFSSMSSSSSSEHEEEQQQQEQKVECSGSSSPVENKEEQVAEEQAEELEIEEETPAFIAEATAAAKEKKKKQQPAKKTKESKRERDSPSADAKGGDDDDGPVIDLPKATDRIKRSTKATFIVNKVDPRVRKLVVSVPKGKRTKEYTYSYVDFPDEEIVQKLKEVMEKYDLDYMNAFQAAMFAPGLFWNAIHHWRTVDALEKKLIEAGVPNGQRRTRQKR
jgi:flagellar biosynthesis GTPase FlhF